MGRLLQSAFPLAVFLGKGANGWQSVTKDGKIDAKTTELLAQKYVCLYVDLGEVDGAPVRTTPLKAGYWGPQYYDDKAQLLDVLTTRRPFRWYGPGAEPPDKVAMFEQEFARRVTPLLHNCGACGERFDSFAGINAGRHDAGFPSPTA